MTPDTEHAPPAGGLGRGIAKLAAVLFILAWSSCRFACANVDGWSAT